MIFDKRQCQKVPSSGIVKIRATPRSGMYITHNVSVWVNIARMEVVNNR